MILTGGGNVKTSAGGFCLKLPWARRLNSVGSLGFGVKGSDVSFGLGVTFSCVFGFIKPSLVCLLGFGFFSISPAFLSILINHLSPLAEVISTVSKLATIDLIKV